MQISRIPLSSTGRFNRLILDYLNQEKQLTEFFGRSNVMANYRLQIEQRSEIPVNRTLLVDSISRQYKVQGGAQNLVATNIQSLADLSTFTVTTGHQLNIFTGPLYFIYKTIHTIRLAEELGRAYPEYRFVPIYWMNSEDHDLAEVGQFNLFGKNRTWKTDQTGATGRMNPHSLVSFCEELKEIFGNDEATLNLVEMFQEAYSQFDTLANATRYFVNELFGKDGLVVIDSDDAGLKSSFSKIIKEDIQQNKPSELIQATNHRLEALGYHAQVNPREINSFYLEKGIRNRIVRTENGFHVLSTDLRFTEKELLDEVDAHPERFSPNVVLRPLFQEYILPNLAYVGGAGELAYWLQYKAYFEHFGVGYPILSLRNHFILIDGATSARMNELTLLPQDLFHSVDDLIKNHLLDISDTEISLDNELAILGKLYNSLLDKAADMDDSVKNSIGAEKMRMAKTIGQWQGRFARELKKQNEVSVNRIQKISDQLFPNGYLQERHDNFLGFYSKYPNSFFSTISASCDPFNTDFTVVEWK